MPRRSKNPSANQPLDAPTTLLRYERCSSTNGKRIIPLVLYIGFNFWYKSWSVRNLYNLWSRSLGPHAKNDIPLNHTTFTRSSASLFKQRWQAKKLVRAYHGDYIPEKKFVKWYLPERLPALHNPSKSPSVEAFIRDKEAYFAEGRKNGLNRATENSSDGQAPISSLMFAELERRIDVVVFRSCFAHSIHAARQLVVHGKVTLNGIKVRVFSLQDTDVFF